MSKNTNDFLSKLYQTYKCHLLAFFAVFIPVGVVKFFIPHYIISTITQSYYIYHNLKKLLLSII